MKNNLLYIIIFLLTGPLAKAQTCEHLFPTGTTVAWQESATPFVEITTKLNKETQSTLFIEEGAFSKNPDQAIIEMIRLLLQNSDFKLEDKNVLIKNKFILAVSLANGYKLELTYASKSADQARFILHDKINLITPSGKEYKVTDSLLKIDEVKIDKSEFPIDSLLNLDNNIKLKIPLTIEGELLKNFTHFAEYFEYFNKDELRLVFQSNSIFRIRTLLKIQKAKKVFYEMLFKGPMKLVINGSLMFAVLNANVFFNEPKTIESHPVPATKVIAVEKKINKFPITLDTASATFIFEKNDSSNPNTKQTYIVFAEEILDSTKTAGIQYHMVEIDAIKYQRLISVIKSQEKIK